MVLQELNIIVTINKKNDVSFQIAPVPTETLIKTKGLKIGRLQSDSVNQKCKNCSDDLKVNLFYTNSLVIIENNGSSDKKEKIKKEKKPRVKKSKSPERVIVDPDVDLLKEEPPQHIKEEPVEFADDVKNEPIYEDNYASNDYIHNSDSEDYEIPEWCKPQSVPKVKKRTKSDPYVLCHICSQKVNKGQLTKHLLRHETPDGKPFQCQHCNKCFTALTPLKCHLLLKHFPDLAPYKCDKCPGVFSSKNHFNRHLSLIHKIGKSLAQTCPICNMVLSSKGILKGHMKSVHTAPSEKPQYKCPEPDCFKIFFKKSHYNAHILIHLPESERPYHCDKCTKTFIHSWVFKKHLLEHENPELLLVKCPDCEKTFKSKDSLKVHRRIHTGETPYHCKFCDRAFADRSNHRTHMKTHEQQLGIKLTLSFEERRLVNHKVLDKEQLINE